MRTMALIVLGLLMISAACQYTEKADPIESGQITYFEDARTGLCFASITSLDSGLHKIVNIANVPCERVSAFIKQ